eukprot:scaffold32422_cov94-Isochrysis_galbana.AAC.2
MHRAPPENWGTLGRHSARAHHAAAPSMLVERSSTGGDPPGVFLLAIGIFLGSRAGSKHCRAGSGPGYRLACESACAGSERRGQMITLRQDLKFAERERVQRRLRRGRGLAREKMTRRGKEGLGAAEL